MKFDIAIIGGGPACYILLKYWIALRLLPNMESQRSLLPLTYPKS